MKSKHFGAGFALLLMIAFAFVPSPAQAQSSRCPQDQGAGNSGVYPPRRGNLTVSDSTVTPGQSIKAQGCGFRPASTVAVDFLSDPVRVGTATAAADGFFSVDVTIPANASRGRHTLEASGVDANGAVLVLSAGLTVTGPGGALPTTGSSSGKALSVAGAGLVVIGAGAVIAARRRRAQGAQPD